MINESILRNSGFRFSRTGVDVPGWMLLALVSAAFLLGGGARSDILSLVLLRPLVAGVLAYSAFRSMRTNLDGLSTPIVLTCLWIAVVASQLVPLPPDIWSELPGRAPIVEAFSAVDAELGWQPISVVPSATVNALLAWFLPLTVLLLFAQASRAIRERAVGLMCAFVLISALLGVIQVVTGSSALYPYAISNEGMPIGLFANRNHQAAIIAAAIPSIMAIAANRASHRSSLQASIWIGRGICLGLTIVAVMTGSRAGTLLALATLVGSSLLLTPNRDPKGRSPVGRQGRLIGLARRLAVPAGLAVVLAAVFLVVQGTAFERLAAKGGLEDLRFKALPAIAEATRDGLPFGYGSGSFPWVYEIYERSELIGPYYLNHAHNDWLEIFIEGGLFLPAIAIAGLIWFLTRGWTLRRSLAKPASEGDRYRLAAAMGIVVLLISSLFDYPLRTPAASAVLMVLVGWFATPYRR